MGILNNKLGSGSGVLQCLTGLLHFSEFHFLSSSLRVTGTWSNSDKRPLKQKLAVVTSKDKHLKIMPKDQISSLMVIHADFFTHHHSNVSVWYLPNELLPFLSAEKQTSKPTESQSLSFSD